MSLDERTFRRIEQPQVVAGVIVFAAIAFTLPFATEQNSWFEWGAAYSGIQQQAISIAETGFPTRFVAMAESGAFYPWFVFYAGGVSSALGYLAQVTGPWGAFLFSIALAFAGGTYGALLALRAIGCPPQLRLLLALAAGFSPYIITNLYGRGAWAELLGVSSAWLLVGAGLSLLGAETNGQRVRRLLLVVSSTFVLAVSHNLSLAIGLPFAIALWVAVAITGRREFQIRNARLLFGSLLLGLLLAGAWLLPNMAYGSKTDIYRSQFFGALESFDQIRVVFSPLLYFPEEQTRLNLASFGQSIPIRVFNQTLSLLLIPIAWVVGSLLIQPLRALRLSSDYDTSTRKREEWIRLSLLLIFAIVLTVLMTNQRIWELLPSAVLIIQFPFRLNSYLTFVIVMCAGVAASIVVGRRHDNKSLVVPLLGVVALFYLVLGSYQVLTAQRVGPPGLGPTSRTEIDVAGAVFPSNQFRIVSEDPLSRPTRRIRISGLGQRVSGVAGQRLATNVDCSPFVEFSASVRVVGSDEYGKCVLEVERPGGVLEVSGAWPLVSKLGFAASVGGLALLVLLLGWEWRSRTKRQ